MRYEHIIWDWNGTLLDDAWLCVEIMNSMLAKRRLPALTASRYAEIFDFPVRDYYLRAGFDFTNEPFETLSDEFMAAYNRRKGEAPLQQYAAAMLDRGQAAGIPQSILSAMEQGSLDDMTARHGVREHFTHISGLDNHHAHSKLENGLALIAALGAAPEKTVYIGDTIHDHEVAEAMGVACILIPSGHHSRTRLEARGVPVISSLNELASEGISK